MNGPSGVRLAVQADGKLAIGDSIGSFSDSAMVGRVNPDGAPDTCFGVGGMATFEWWQGPIWPIALLANGQILVAGKANPAVAGIPSRQWNGGRCPAQTKGRTHLNGEVRQLIEEDS